MRRFPDTDVWPWSAENARSAPPLYAALPSDGPGPALLRLHRGVLKVLADSIADGGGDIVLPSGLRDLCTFHEMNEVFLGPMMPGTQSDMVKASHYYAYPLLIAEKGRSAWGDPLDGDVHFERLEQRIRWNLRWHRGMELCTYELSEADLRLLALAVSSDATLDDRFGELAAVDPELATHILKYGFVMLPHLPDGVFRRFIEPHLRRGVVLPAIADDQEKAPRRFDKFGFLPHSPRRVARSRVQTHERVGEACPECEAGSLVLRHTRRGKPFLGCDQYPQCRYSVWLKD